MKKNKQLLEKNTGINRRIKWEIKSKVNKPIGKYLGLWRNKFRIHQRKIITELIPLGGDNNNGATFDCTSGVGCAVK